MDEPESVRMLARMRLLALAVILAAACSKAAADPPPSAVQDAAPAPPPPLADKSGDRLKLRFGKGEDGSLEQLGARYDSKFQERCTDSCASDGKMRCLPDAATVVDGFYADKDCSQRIAWTPKGRTAPAHAALLSKDAHAGAGYWCEYTQQSRIFKIDGEYREIYVYLKDPKSGSCTKVTSREDATLDEFSAHMQPFLVSTEVSPSEFVAVALSPSGDPTK